MKQPFFQTHILWPLALFIIGVYFLDIKYLNLDVADSIYQQEGGSWALRRHWFFNHVLHSGGRALVGAMLFTVITLLALSFYRVPLQRFRRGFTYLFAVTALSMIIINIVKEFSQINCPWSLTRYGGTHAFIGLFDFKGPEVGGGHCFPSGHASAGYAWVSIYFFCLVYYPAWRYKALTLSLMLGLIFGITQQLRGAHFLSHDVWSLAICWFISLFGYLFLRSGKAASSTVSHINHSDLNQA